MLFIHFAVRNFVQIFLAARNKNPPEPQIKYGGEFIERTHGPWKAGKAFCLLDLEQVSPSVFDTHLLSPGGKKRNTN